MAVSGSHGLRQEVTFVVQDDEPVGLDGVRVIFDDERVVSDAGIMLVATLAGGWGSRRSRSGWCGCGEERPGAAQRGPQGDDAGVRDGAGRGQHR